MGDVGICALVSFHAVKYVIKYNVTTVIYKSYLAMMKFQIRNTLYIVYAEMMFKQYMYWGNFFFLKMLSTMEMKMTPNLVTMVTR